MFELLLALKTKSQLGDEFLDYSHTLDKFYILTKVSNGFPAGSPFEDFTEKEAKSALLCAGRIVEFCESVLARERQAP